MKKLYFLVLASIFLQCGGGESTTNEIKLSGINGEAYYYINKRTKKVEKVVKEEYAYKADLICINKDTLIVNDDLKAYFSIDKKDFMIKINKPTQEEIEGSYEPISGVAREIDTYKFKTTEEGIFDLEGTVEYDSLSIPFHYRFIVLPKN